MFKVISIITIHCNSNNDYVTFLVRNECLIDAPSESTSPCVNGFCIDGTDTYFCQCFSGFIGTNCNEAGNSLS